MDDDTQAITAGYQSFDSYTESTSPKTGASTTQSPPAAAAIPARYQTNTQRTDNNLVEDLRQTATGTYP